jgi:hypothetical protein
MITLHNNHIYVHVYVCVYTAILILLSSPAIDSPLNVDAANLLKYNDILGYKTLVRCCTAQHAKKIDEKYINVEVQNVVNIRNDNDEKIDKR